MIEREYQKRKNKMNITNSSLSTNIKEEIEEAVRLEGDCNVGAVVKRSTLENVMTTTASGRQKDDNDRVPRSGEMIQVYRRQ